jgi:hypothetical protein
MIAPSISHKRTHWVVLWVWSLSTFARKILHLFVFPSQISMFPSECQAPRLAHPSIFYIWICYIVELVLVLIAETLFVERDKYIYIGYGRTILLGKGQPITKPTTFIIRRSWKLFCTRLIDYFLTFNEQCFRYFQDENKFNNIIYPEVPDIWKIPRYS